MADRPEYKSKWTGKQVDDAIGIVEANKDKFLTTDDIEQSTGTSPTKVMSQVAVTNAIKNVDLKDGSVTKQKLEQSIQDTLDSVGNKVDKLVINTTTGSSTSIDRDGDNIKIRASDNIVPNMKESIIAVSNDSIRLISNGNNLQLNESGLTLNGKNIEPDIDNESITQNEQSQLQAVGIKYNDNLITAEMLYNTTHFIRYKDAPSFSRTFSENSFATISQISKNEISNMTETGDDLYTAIETKYGWKVGDTIQYTIASGDNAGTYTAQIWDFNNAVDKDGNKNGILLGNVELLTTLAKMNDTNTNKGGFGASAMATTTLPAVYETLPDDLKNVIRETKVTYHSGSDDPDTELSGYYKLYLPSEFEMFNSTQFALQEGQYLKYWQTHDTDADRKKTQVGQSSSQWYWLRSAFRSGSDDFAIVSSAGSLNVVSASYANGVCLMFSI